MVRHMRTAAALVAALVLAPAVADAQPWTAQFTSQGAGAGSTWGPYNGSLTGGTLPSSYQLQNLVDAFWCLDVAGTYGNGNPVTVSLVSDVADAGLRSRLLQASYLTTRLGTTDVRELHTAIWRTMAPGTTSHSLYSNSANVSNLLADATANAGSVDGSRFLYISFTGGTFVPGGRQELIVDVPEPSSMLLLATGLGFVGVAARRRRTS